MKPTPLRIENPERFRAIWAAVQRFFDNVNYPVFELKGQGSDVLTYCNRAFSLALESQPPDLVGRALSDLALNKNECERIGSNFRNSPDLREVGSPYVVNLRSQSGHGVFMSLDILDRVSDTGIDLGCFVVAQRFDRSEWDVSETIRRVFYEIVERSGEAIGIAADDGTFLYRNPAHRELFGHTDGPVGDVSIRDLLVATEEGKTTASILNDPAETGEWEDSRTGGEWVGLVSCRTPAGIKPAWIRKHHIKDPVTEELISFAFLHDYSNELAQLNELAEAKQAAEHARQTQHHLFHAVSHDLRTILQAASLYLDTADRKVTKRGDKIDEIGRARDAIFSVQDHFQKILDVVASDTGIFKPKIEYIKGQEVVDYVYHTYRALADAKGIELHTKGCACLLATDASLMKRTVGNLVSNAIKFTPRGSVTITGIQTENRCGIEVRDTGVGVPEKFRERIFDQFYQINPDDQDSLGIGLSISMQICDLLGHEIEVTNNDAGGAVFTVWSNRVLKS